MYMEEVFEKRKNSLNFFRNVKSFSMYFAWHLHLMEQKLNILHSFLASAMFDDLKLNLGEMLIQCYVIPFVNLCFISYCSN